MKCRACYWCFFIWFGDMSDIFYDHYYALTPFCDSALLFTDQVRILFHSNYHPYMLWLLACDHDGIHCFLYQLLH